MTEQERTSHVLKALADPVRLQIMDRLSVHPCGVTELSRSLPITRQGTTKHLGVLRRAGLVESVPGGSGEGYRVVPAPVDEASRVLARAADRWTTQLALLKEAAEHAAGTEESAAEVTDVGLADIPDAEGQGGPSA